MRVEYQLDRVDMKRDGRIIHSKHTVEFDRLCDLACKVKPIPAVSFGSQLMTVDSLITRAMKEPVTVRVSSIETVTFRLIGEI